MKTDFSSPVATAEFSKLAGLLSAAHSQHHLSGFEEELPHVRRQGQWLRGAIPRPRPVAAGRRHPTSEVRGGQEKPPRAQARGGDPEEPPRARGQGRQLGGATHTRVQGRWLGGATPHPRSGGCAGAGGPRGAIPHSRSGGVAVRRYPLSKVRSSSYALLEQP